VSSWTHLEFLTLLPIYIDMKLWVITALVGFGSVSSAFSAGSTTNAIAEKKAAIVKIKSMQAGLQSGSGTGFFVSPDGWLVTNTHVVTDAFKEGWTAEFELADGTRYSSDTDQVEWGRCELSGLNDLCLVKLTKHKPKAWFTYSTPYAATSGTSLFAYGHPKGLDFSISEGVLSSYRKFDFLRQKIADASTAAPKEVIQTTVPLNPGNSGGPIFDKTGNLVGVSTFSMENAEGIHFGISRNELAKFIGSSPTFKPMKVFKENFASLLRERSRDAVKKIQDAHMNGTGLVGYQVGTEKLRLKIFVPGDYLRCRSVEGDALSYHCKSVDANLPGEMRITISMIDKDLASDSLADEKIPTILNDVLHQTGHWATATKAMTPAQIQEKFYSRSSPRVCTVDSMRVCNSTITNLMELGTVASRVYVQYPGLPLVGSFTMVSPFGEPMKRFTQTMAEMTARGFGAVNRSVVMERVRTNATQEKEQVASADAPAVTVQRSTASAYLTRAELQSRTQFTGTCRKPFLFKEKGAPKYWSYLFAIEGSGQFVPVHDYRNLNPGNPPQCTSATSVSGTWEDDQVGRTSRRVLGVR